VESHIRIRAAAAVIRTEEHRDRALGWLDSIAARTASSEAPASERADLLLQITGISDPYDREAANGYYRAAIRAAEALDDEGAGVLGVFAALAEHCTDLPQRRREKLAARLKGATDRFESFVSDTGYLQRPRVLHAVTALHPPTGLATMCRWDLEAKEPLTRTLTGTLGVAAERGFIGPPDAFRLSFLAGPDAFDWKDAARHVDQLLTEARSKRPTALALVDDLIGWLLRDASPERRATEAPRLLAWIEGRKLRPRRLDELRALAEFVTTLPAAPDRWAGPPESRSAREDQLTAAIESGQDDTPADIAARVEAFADAWATDQQVCTYLDEVSGRVAPARRRGYLDLLAALPGGHVLWRRFGEAVLTHLAGALSRWVAREDIAVWRKEVLPHIVADRFNELAKSEHAADKSLALVIGLGLPDPGRVILLAAGPRLGELNTGQLFGLARSLGRTIGAIGCAEVLGWSLDHYEVVTTPVPDPPKDFTGTIGGVLQTLLGHPDRRVRWHAAHTTRSLLHSQPAIARVILSAERAPTAFVPTGYEPFWMSSLHWAAMAVARASADEPTALLAHTRRLVQLATDATFPHVAVRAFAARAALNSHRSGARKLPRGQVTALEAVSVPSATQPMAPDRPGDRVDQDYDSGRFIINGMDTIPYWYRPLAERVGLPTEEIVQRALQWIEDRFGFNQANTGKEHDLAQVPRYEWSDHYTRQGAIPPVEDLDSYLEYHAMLLVAGELLDQGQPVVFDNDYYGSDRWDSWLAEHLDTNPAAWICDRRQPAPLEPAVYGHAPTRSQWRVRNDADFDSMLSNIDGALIVHSSEEVRLRDRYSDSWVASALVSPENATALLHALQTCDNPTDFRLPLATDGDHPDDMEISEPPFRLTGWLADQQHHELGMEEHDDLRRIDLRTVLPAAAFLAHHEATVDDLRSEVTAPDGTRLAWTETWSDERHERRSYDTRGGSGRRTWLAVPALLSFLSGVNMKLILEVRVSRNFSSDAGYDDEGVERYEQGPSIIYLLGSNGSLQTLARSRRLR
jgi:hypothetical protein